VLKTQICVIRPQCVKRKSESLIQVGLLPTACGVEVSLLC